MERSVGKRVCIVGAGPAGLAAAIFLAQQGYDINVFDKRDYHPQANSGSSPQRTIFYGLSGRGKSALQAAGVRLPEQLGQRLGGMTKGGSMYGTFRTRTWWGTETTKVSGNMLPDWTLIDRAGLVEHLTAETQRLHPDRIKLHFQHVLQSVDWEKQEVVVQKEADGSTVSFQYDLLVAADGRHSKCRRLYQKFDPSFSCYLRPAPKHYVGFAGITLPEDMAAGCVLRDKEGLHLKIWRGHSQQWSIMLSENTAGSVTGFLSAEREAIAPVSTHAEYTAVLEDHFRHMPASLRRLIADGIMGSPKQDMGASGSVSSLVGPRFVLMGDAAHSVLPNLGQGCNSGLQDSHIFSKILDESDQDLDAALLAFEAKRHPETLALHQLDMISGTWWGTKGKWHPIALAFKFHMLVQTLQAKLGGGGFKQTPFYQLMQGGIPYSKAKAVWERDRNICFAGAAALSAAAMSWAVRSFT